MKQVLTMLLAVFLLLGAQAWAEPFPVGPDPAEPNWQSWGYTVDGQVWANWFEVEIPWGTDADMSGTWVIQEDFLIWVDPETSGLSDPSSVYGEDWWNHDGVYGLGEFFDAGWQSSDMNYVLTLDLVAPIVVGSDDSQDAENNDSEWAPTWEVWYDANRNQVLGDASSEHPILAGTVVDYWNRGGYFYGVLMDDDGEYDGYFSPSHDEGTPLLYELPFHAGKGEPVPEPSTILLLGAGLLGLALAGRRKFRK